jgi:hypothetical protein
MVKHVAVFFLSLAVPALAGAQTAPTLENGSRIRILTSTSAQPITGKLVRQNATTLTLEVAGGAGLMVARDSVMRMELSRRRSRAATAGWGTLLGAIAGFMGGVAQGDDPPGGWVGGWTAIQKGTALGVLGAPVGLVTGLIIGPGKDHWTAVDSKTSATLTPVITRSRIGLAGSIRW